MAKHADAIRAALEKKRAAQNPELQNDADVTAMPKIKGRSGAMAPAAKPMKKVTGRGR